MLEVSVAKLERHYMLKTTVILGTNRPGNKSQHVATFVMDQLASDDRMDAQLVKPEDLNLPYDGNDEASKDPKFTKIAEETDAFILIVPEYNHSFPASLKRILDSELGNYTHKPVALVGVSAGPWGGTRAVESMLMPLREMGFVVTYSDMYVTDSYGRFDEEGTMTKDVEMYKENCGRMLDELAWMGDALKVARDADK